MNHPGYEPGVRGILYAHIRDHGSADDFREASRAWDRYLDTMRRMTISPVCVDTLPPEDQAAVWARLEPHGREATDHLFAIAARVSP